MLIVANSAIISANTENFTNEEIQRYFEKFNLLKQQGYLDPTTSTSHLSGRLNGELVKETLANTLSIILEVTEKCNLNCSYCSYGKHYNHFTPRENQQLDIKKTTTFLDYIFQLKKTSLNRSLAQPLQIGFYGGEPLLNIPLIKGVTQYLRKRKDIPRTILTMTTNATLLDKYMGFIVENNIHFNISLDGSLDNNSYRVFFNGKPSYNKVFQNIKLFQKTHPKYFEKHVGFLSVLHDRNSIKEINTFLKSEFNKIANISEVSPVGVASEMRGEFSKMFRNLYEDLFQQENYAIDDKNKQLLFADRTIVTKMLHQHCCHVYQNYRELLFGNTQIPLQIPTGTCLPFYYKVFLTSSGNILPCEKIGHQFALGNIDGNNIVNIDCENIAVKYNKLYDKLEEQCGICHNATLCSQCIFNIKDIDEHTPTCNGCLSEQEFSKYLATQVGYLEKYQSQYSFIMKNIIGK